MGERKTVGSAFVEKLSASNLTKEQLFEQFYNIAGKDCNLSELGLPSNPAVAFLESSKAKFRIKLYNQKAMSALQKLDKIKNVAQKKAILDMLNIMAPEPKDYGVIALDTYLKMDKKHTIDSFYKEYNIYQQKQKSPPQMKNKMVYKGMAMELS